MNRNFTIRAIYSGGIDLKIQDVELSTALFSLTLKDDFLKQKPIIVEVPELQKFLKYNYEAFCDFCSKKITITDLVINTECKGYFRNDSELEIEGEIIDKGSFWMISKTALVLVDDDQFIESNYLEDEFTLIE